MPDLDEEDLTIFRLMQNLMQFIYKEGMKMASGDLKSDGENKRFYIIEEGPKKETENETENENYNYNRYLLIHQHLIKIIKLRCYKDGVLFFWRKNQLNILVTNMCIIHYKKILGFKPYQIK